MSTPPHSEVPPRLLFLLIERLEHVGALVSSPGIEYLGDWEREEPIAKVCPGEQDRR